MTQPPRWIDYRQLPASAGGYSSLFLDYLYNPTSVAGYFPAPFRNGSGFESVLRSVETRQPDRATLTAVLHEQNLAYGAGSKTLENISLLEKPNTYAVVTGQQVGLFGGPLYSLFKSITAIKLARRLATKFPDRSFVPVFWLEGEDHDFEEMNSVTVLGQDGMPVTLTYLPGGIQPEHNLGPIGELVFDEWIEKTIQSLVETLQKTEYTESVVASLRSCYRPGATFNHAFASWLSLLLADSGLVFMSVHTPRLKRLLAPMFAREIAEFPAVSQLVITQSAELEQRYHAQVKTKSVNLFMFHKGGRFLIEPREHDFSLKGTRHFVPRDTMLQIARETPEVLSTNVVLRPIAQDILLPTVAYVAGPAEIAYHAQILPVYAHFGVTRPVIFPRASASVIEERVVRIVEKFGLALEGFFGERDKLVASVVEQLSEVKVESLFVGAEQHIRSALTELRFGINDVDSTLLGTLDNITGKIIQNIGVLRDKTAAAQQRQHETSVRQIDRSIAALLPHGTMQERELNVLYFLNKYGPGFPAWIMQELEIDGYKHQLLLRDRSSPA